MSQHNQFATTHWSIVRQAGQDDSPQARSALETLCQRYWFPLYSFVRFKGYSAADAEDLTQSFFASLFQRNDFQKAQPELGRFRSYLLGAMKNFLANEWDKKQAQKRGGNIKHLSIDFNDADSRYRQEPAKGETADQWYERQWALTLLEQVHEKLQKEFEERGKLHIFQGLSKFLAGKNEESTLAQEATKLGMSEVAVKVAVHRLRGRFGLLLRQEIENTLDSQDQVEDEIGRLFEVLRQ